MRPCSRSVVITLSTSGKDNGRARTQTAPPWSAVEPGCASDGRERAGQGAALLLPLELDELLDLLLLDAEPPDDELLDDEPLDDELFDDPLELLDELDEPLDDDDPLDELELPLEEELEPLLDDELDPLEEELELPLEDVELDEAFEDELELLLPGALEVELDDDELLPPGLVDGSFELDELDTSGVDVLVGSVRPAQPTATMAAGALTRSRRNWRRSARARVSDDRS